MAPGVRAVTYTNTNARHIPMRRYKGKSRQLRIADCGLRTAPSAERSVAAGLSATAAIVGILLFSGAAAQAETVAEIVAKMPAKDPATGQPMLEKILALGEPGVRDLCSLVTPPKDTSDAGARYAVHGLVLHTKRPGAEVHRTLVEKALIGALGSALDPDLKVFFIEQLQLCGSDDCAGAIGSLLDDDKLCGPASRALTRLGTAKCVALLRAELPEAKGKRLVAIVQALGVLGDEHSAHAILPCAKARDADLRHTAWYALANIGEAGAADVLLAASAGKEAHERTLGTKYLFLLARRQVEDGKAESAAGICRELLKTRTDPADAHVRCAALAVLQKANPAGAADELLAAMAGENAQVRQAAMNLLAAGGGEKTTAKIVERTKAAKGQAKADLVALLGRRGDKTAAPTVLAAMDDSDPAVAAAATEAAASVAPERVVALMTARMKGADATAIAAAKGVLLRTKADGLEEALTAAMADASPAGKVALLEVLTARGTRGKSKVAFDALKDADKAVQLAAAKALGTLAGPADLGRAIELLLETDSQAVRTAAQRVVVGLSRSEGPKAVLAALAKDDAKARPILLATLARVGGKDALAAMIRELFSTDPAVKDAAARALADWQGPEALEPMAVHAIRTDSEVHRVLLIRGIARLVGQGEGIRADRALTACAKALKAVTRPTEKNLILGAMGNVQTVEAVELAAEYMDDAATREAAANTVVQIACPKRRYRGLTGPAVVEALNKVVATSKNQRNVEQAAKHLANIKKGK